MYHPILLSLQLHSKQSASCRTFCSLLSSCSTKLDVLVLMLQALLAHPYNLNLNRAYKKFLKVYTSSYRDTYFHFIYISIIFYGFFLVDTGGQNIPLFSRDDPSRFVSEFSELTLRPLITFSLLSSLSLHCEVAMFVCSIKMQ